MSRLDVMEWAGAVAVATAAGMFDVRLGIFAAGVWLIWFANISEESGDDDGADDQ